MILIRSEVIYCNESFCLVANGPLLYEIYLILTRRQALILIQVSKIAQRILLGMYFRA
jgi:hypothetical protein